MKSPAYVKLWKDVIAALICYSDAITAYMVEHDRSARCFHRLVECNEKLEEAIHNFDVYGGTDPREREFFHQLRWDCRYHYGETFEPFGARRSRRSTS